MKVFLACCFLCLGLAGCIPSEDSLDWLFGIKHNAVVLTSSPMELSQPEVGFTPSVEAKVVGKESRVCVVLSSGAPGAPWKDNENEGQRLLNGAKLAATVTTSDGATHEFRCQGPSWARSGRIVPANEIAICLQPSCSKQASPIGSTVKRVAIFSTAPVHALGAYWDSTAAFDRSGN